MSKILIMQHYSRNKGNVSLLYALVESIKAHIPRAQVVVSSFDPAQTEKLFGYDSCEWPFNTRRAVNARGVRRVLWVAGEILLAAVQVATALLVRMRLLNPARLSGRFAVIREMCSADLMVSPGGHLFTTLNRPGQFFAHFFHCLMCVLLKRRYAVIAQTIGPFSGRFRIPDLMMTRFVLKHAAYTSFRDEGTFETLKKHGIHTDKAAATNEIVFLFPEPSVRRRGEADRPVVGVTIHHIYYKRWMSKERYLAEMADLIGRITGELGGRVRLISMEDNTTGRGDMPFIRELVAALGGTDEVEIVDTSMDPRELLAVVADLDMLVATKTHSVVYGLRMKVPTLAIAYDQKTHDFMGRFGQSRYSIALDGLTAEGAFARLQELAGRRQRVREELVRGLEAVAEQAMESIRAIERLLGDN